MFSIFATLAAAIAAMLGAFTPSVDNPNDLDPAACVTGYESECVWIGDSTASYDETVVTYAEANDFGFYVELSDGTVVDLPQCAAEDDTDCIWIADLRGNGVGRSFVDIAGEVFYFGETL